MVEEGAIPTPSLLRGLGGTRLGVVLSLPVLPKVGDDARIAPRGIVQARALENGAVLVNMHSGGCFELNPVGFEIWKGLEQGRSVSEICNTLVGKYGVQADVASGDIRSLVDSLIEAGLVEIVRA